MTTEDSTSSAADRSEQGRPSIWFKDPGYGMPDAADEQLAAEPEDVKALRMLRVLRAYIDQQTHPFAAMKLDGKPLVTMRAEHWSNLMEATSWLYNWQRRAADLMQQIHADLEHELAVSGYDETLRDLLAEEFEDRDGDDD